MTLLQMGNEQGLSPDDVSGIPAAGPPTFQKTSAVFQDLGCQLCQRRVRLGRWVEHTPMEYAVAEDGPPPDGGGLSEPADDVAASCYHGVVGRLRRVARLHRRPTNIQLETTRFLKLL